MIEIECYQCGKRYHTLQHSATGKSICPYCLALNKLPQFKKEEKHNDKNS